MPQGNQESQVLQVRVLGMEGCPNTPRAAELVQMEAAALGIPLALHRVVVRTEEEARQERFPGSPTVQVEGQDIEPGARGGETFSLT